MSAQDKTIIRATVCHSDMPIRRAVERLASSGRLVSAKIEGGSMVFIDDHNGAFAAAIRDSIVGVTVEVRDE